MDIVVQYGLPKDLCTLWQRFGCAGESEATAVLLAEPQYFDDDRKEKIAKKMKRVAKRKAGSPLAAPYAKRSGSTDHCQDPAVVVVADDSEDSNSDTPTSDGDASVDESIFERRTDEAKQASYNAPPTRELGSALDDLVNARTRGIPCRRIVPNTFFLNNNACMFLNFPINSEFFVYLCHLLSAAPPVMQLRGMFELLPQIVPAML